MSSQQLHMSIASSGNAQKGSGQHFKHRRRVVKANKSITQESRQRVKQPSHDQLIQDPYAPVNVNDSIQNLITTTTNALITPKSAGRITTAAARRLNASSAASANANRSAQVNSRAQRHYNNVLSLQQQNQTTNAGSSWNEEYGETPIHVKTLDQSFEAANNSNLRKSISANHSFSMLQASANKLGRRNTQEGHRSSLQKYQDQNTLMIIDEDQKVKQQQPSSGYQQVMHKLAQTLSTGQVYRLRTLLASQEFLKRMSNASSEEVSGGKGAKEVVRGIQNMIRDVLGIKLTAEDTEILVKHSQGKTIDRNPYKERTTSQDSHYSPDDRRSLTSSRLEHSFTVQRGSSSSYLGDGSTTATQTTYASTAFSRPFSSFSYQTTSTSGGSSLTNKLDRMNKAAMKLTAKQFLACQAQLEQSLSKQKLSMRTKLTIPEMHVYMQGTDLSTVSLTHLQNLLIAVLFITLPPNASDLLLSFKSLMVGCQNFLDQAEIEVKDVYNKTKMDKIIDDVRDYIYTRAANLRILFSKYTDCEGQEAALDRVVMTAAHFVKFVKHIVADRHSTRDIEQVYRNVVSKKPMTLSRFVKKFSHQPVEDSWLANGLRILRDYMKHKKLDPAGAFQRLGGQASGNPKKLNKAQWRDAVRREGLPFNCIQMDFMLEKLDHNQDGLVDAQDWLMSFQMKQEVGIDALGYLRGVVSKHHLSAEDLLYRIKKRMSDPAMSLKAFREALLRFDSSLDRGLIDQVFERLVKKGEEVVEVGKLVKELIGDPSQEVAANREVTKRLQQHLASRADLLQAFRLRLEAEDIHNDGTIAPDRLVKVLTSLGLIQDKQAERWVRTAMDKDKRGRISYEKLLLKVENTHERQPIKALALRLAVFMQQNGLTCKKLVDKLIETKNNSKTNQARNKATSSFISVNFFSKFLKAKVDKSRALDDLLAIVSTSLDMDRDGVISVADLEAFVGRTHFQDFLEKQPLSTAGRARNVHRGGLDTIKKLEDTIRRLSTSSVPREAPVAGKEEQLTMMAEVLPKLREVLQSRSLTLPQAFALFDHNSLGLLTFPSFSQTLDTLLSISGKAKETLFKKMDRLNIGLVSYADFKKVINADAVGLRLIGNAKVEDTFDWEQSMIRTVLEWILTNRLSLSEAFKLMDRDFDGVLTLSDLSKYLQETFGVDPETHKLKVQRLFRVLDLGKTGKVYMVDFENMFSRVYKQRGAAKMGRTKSAIGTRKSTTGFVVDWKQSCLEQIVRYIKDNYGQAQQAFTECVREESKRAEPIVKMEAFLAWVQGRDVLSGFNLTRDLTCKLFAWLDPHRKGYLNLNDWLHLFDKREDIESIVGDIKRALGESFTSLETVIKFMGNEVNRDRFTATVDHILPKRFTRPYLELAWASLIGGTSDPSEAVMHFLKAMEGVKYRAETKLTARVAKHLTRSNSDPNLDHVLNLAGPETSPHGKEKYLRNLSPRQATFAQLGLIFDKLRLILRTRGIGSITELFGGRAETNLVEFRNAIGKMGMTTREINRMYQAITSDECNGKIDLGIITKKFQRLEQDQGGLESRDQERVRTFKQLLIKYMNSIEDAFLLYDSSNKNKMTFNDFQRLLSHIYTTCEGRTPPNQPLARDLFDIIDIKCDGLLDFYEWRHTFGLEKHNAREDFLTGRQMWDQGAEIKVSYPTAWPQNKEYMNLLNQVARNRKTLCANYRKLEENPKLPGTVEYDLGVAAFIKYVRETLNLSEKQYPDLQLQEMIQPFGEIMHGHQVFKYLEFAETLRNRHFLLSEATKNRHASVPREIRDLLQ